MIGIYKITNNLNGKFYVGQSNDIERRFKEHCYPSRYLSSNIPLDWAIHKYGKENFSLEILEECSIEELNQKETEWIHKLKAVELGYNCNEGGNTGVQGETNPNAKLTREDVILIRQYYASREKTQKEVYTLFKDKVTWQSFRSVWQGTSWADIMPEVFTEENKNYYKTQGNNRNYAFSEEEVLKLRNQYVNHTAKELYPPYKDIVQYQTFQHMLCGFSYKNIPYFHKKTKKWIYPGETPKKSPNRGNRREKMTWNAYEDSEVLQFREQYISKTAKEIYETTDKRIGFESFQKMLRGATYKHLPCYSKNKQQWVYK